MEGEVSSYQLVLPRFLIRWRVYLCVLCQTWRGGSRTPSTQKTRRPKRWKNCWKQRRSWGITSPKKPKDTAAASSAHQERSPPPGSLPPMLVFTSPNIYTRRLPLYGWKIKWFPGRFICIQNYCKPTILFLMLLYIQLLILSAYIMNMYCIAFV